MANIRRYVVRPEVFEAVQYLGTKESKNEVQEWLGKRFTVKFNDIGDKKGVWIKANFGEQWLEGPPSWYVPPLSYIVYKNPSEELDVYSAEYFKKVYKLKD